jgi:hypothetical protein
MSTREYHAAYYAANKERNRPRAAAYYASHKKEQTAAHKAWMAVPANRAKHYVRCMEYAAGLKREVLAHYSPGGIEPMCSFPLCGISNVNMLVLDHIDNNGGKERKSKGTKIYGRLQRENYPPGYQTLCCNHNTEKELLRRRERKL